MAYYMFKYIVSAAAGLGLAGCAHRENLVHIEGALPSSGTYIFSPTSDKLLTELHPLVGEHLVRNGLKSGEAGASYLVQAALSRRPGSSGAYVPSEQRTWLRRPYRSASPKSQLTLTLTSTADGKEVFRASSASWSKKPLDIKLANQLTAHIFTPENEPHRETVAAQ